MKKIKLTIVALLASMISISAHAGNHKELKSIKMSNQDFNVAGFSKYLVQGNAIKVEGVYQTEDGRYSIAIVKNDAKEHDFIGVMINSGNDQIKGGDVRFNFVESSNNNLEGYFYDNYGNSVPVEFGLDKVKLGDISLKKIRSEKLYENLIS
ncbi:MAG: hypothetical protein CMO34_01665 [Verrucomicrobia bacterium]|nr:hypothetical protein [Verrucomicrobiota bacterium]